MHRSSPISRQRPPEQGFTLVELLVTVTIAAILLALAAPSFSTMLQRKAVESNVDAFVTDLRLARSEAIKRGVQVELCGVAVAANGTRSCINTRTADWSTNGWMVRDVGNTNVVVKVQQSVSGVGAATAAFGTGRSSFVFSPTGILVGGEGHLLITPKNANQTADQQIICIAATGRPRVADKGVGQC